MRTYQKGLGIGVADAAAAGMPLKIDQIFFKFGTKMCVFDVVNLALEAFFLAVDDQTASACAQMRMIVNPEKDIKYAILLGSYAKKTAHDGSSL